MKKLFVIMVVVLAAFMAESAKAQSGYAIHSSTTVTTVQEETPLQSWFPVGQSSLPPKQGRRYSFSNFGKNTEVKEKGGSVTVSRFFDWATGTTKRVVTTTKSKFESKTPNVDSYYTPKNYDQLPDRHPEKNWSPTRTTYGPVSPITRRAPTGTSFGSGGSYRAGGAGYKVYGQ